MGYEAFRARHPEATDPGGDVSLPELLTRVSPQYPTELTKKRRYGGVLQIPIVVSESGIVADAEALCSSGHNADLAPFAVAAVKQWRYKPAARARKAVPAFLMITVTICVR